MQSQKQTNKKTPNSLLTPEYRAEQFLKTFSASGDLLFCTFRKDNVDGLKKNNFLAFYKKQISEGCSFGLSWMETSCWPFLHLVSGCKTARWLVLERVILLFCQTGKKNLERANLWSLTIYEYLCGKSYWFVYHPPPLKQNPSTRQNGEWWQAGISWSEKKHPLRFFWTCADSLPDLQFEAAARKKLTSAYFQRAVIKCTPPFCVNMSSCQKTWRCLDRTRCEGRCESCDPMSSHLLPFTLRLLSLMKSLDCSPRRHPLPRPSFVAPLACQHALYSWNVEVWIGRAFCVFSNPFKRQRLSNRSSVNLDTVSLWKWLKAAAAAAVWVALRCKKLLIPRFSCLLLLQHSLECVLLHLFKTFGTL